MAYRILKPMRAASGGLRALGRPITTTSRTAVSPASTAAATAAGQQPRLPTPMVRRPASIKVHQPQPPADVFDAQPAIVPAASTADSAALGAVPSPPAAAAPNGSDGAVDWSNSFHGLSTTPFGAETAAVLMRPLDAADVEIKPDGIVYLPEIKYRRILNTAFGPGGWGLAPRGELAVGEKVVTQEYALIVHGRFIAQARGECQYFSQDAVATAGEGCKSNALLRCCKDLGIASELWDPRYIRDFKKKHAHEIWVEHVATKKMRKIWVRKDCEPAYPYASTKKTGAA